MVAVVVEVGDLRPPRIPGRQQAVEAPLPGVVRRDVALQRHEPLIDQTAREVLGLRNLDRWGVVGGLRTRRREFGPTQDLRGSLEVEQGDHEPVQRGALPRVRVRVGALDVPGRQRLALRVGHEADAAAVVDGDGQRTKCGKRPPSVGRVTGLSICLAEEERCACLTHGRHPRAHGVSVVGHVVVLPDAELTPADLAAYPHAEHRPREPRVRDILVQSSPPADRRDRVDHEAVKLAVGRDHPVRVAEHHPLAGRRVPREPPRVHTNGAANRRAPPVGLSGATEAPIKAQHPRDVGMLLGPRCARRKALAKDRTPCRSRRECAFGNRGTRRARCLLDLKRRPGRLRGSGKQCARYDRRGRAQ